MGFMYAPRYHPAMKAVRPVRSALKVRTALNLLGPLLNPARAPYGLVGVYSTDISHLMADTLMVSAKQGTSRALPLSTGCPYKVLSLSTKSEVPWHQGT
jgi:anthranilate phosphoribosyltransferase